MLATPFQRMAATLVLLVGVGLAPVPRSLAQQPGARPEKGSTYIAPPADLLSILQAGDAPQSIEQLRMMETQQRQIAEKAKACTVNIQIDSREAGSTQGCGVIITDDGYVLTAAHVAERPKLRVKLTLYDGRIVTARTLGMNRSVDAGLIKIDAGQNEGEPWAFASIGESGELQPGMWCLATGHPGGFDDRRGAVTRVGRILAIRKNSIVTDCALIGGDSGGPLFDLQGRLIAVHSRIGNDVADNLHVPVHHYENSWDDLVAAKAWGFLPGFKPILGVTGRPDTEQAVLDVVHPGSPADLAGLKSGDIIEGFGSEVITDFQSLKDAVAETMPGRRIVMRVLRDGKRKRALVEIGRDPRFTE